MATSQMIELECPSCGEELEIDGGFAGGVCRCSECGTLMTVPEDPARGHAESLSRPSRPDAPVRVDEPGSVRRHQPEKVRPGAPVPSVRTDAPRSRPSREENDADRPSFASVASIELGSGEVLVTTSGREVKLGSDTQIPTAGRRRRPVVRFVTGFVFVAFLGVVVLGTLFALFLFFGPGRGSDDAIEYIPQPERNPFLEPGPTMLNVPLQNRVALVIDGTRSSETWIGEIDRALQITLANFGQGRAIKVYVVSEDGVITYPRGDEFAQFGPPQRAQLQQIMQDEVFPYGSFDLSGTLTRVLQSNPHQVILITGARFGSSELEEAGTQLQETQGAIPAIDAIPIGGEANSSDYRAFIREAHGPRPGIYSPWDRSRIERWYEDWERAAGEQGYEAVFDLPRVDPLPPLPEPEPTDPPQDELDPAAPEASATGNDAASETGAEPAPAAPAAQ